MARGAPPPRRLLITLVAAAPLLLGACSPGRGVEALRLLEDVAAGEAPSALKDLTPPPERAADVPYRVAGRSHSGDLYQPGQRAKAALVLVPGAAPEGKDDARLVAFATTLARTRFSVLVPEISNLRALQVRPSDARGIADAVRHLSATDVGAPVENGVGLVAISYAVGPAILAALEADIRPKVRFIVAVGGYYDLEAVVTFFTTGHFRRAGDEPWRRAEPNPYGRWIFLKSNAALVADARDRALLVAIAERKLHDLGAPIDDLAGRLGPEGGSVLALLTNPDPEAVPRLIAGLPEAIRSDMAALDLARRDLSTLAAELILIHGRDDRIIPHTESLALAAAAPADKVSLTLVDNLAHVDLGPGGLLDGARLLAAAYRLLALRDAIAAGPGG